MLRLCHCCVLVLCGVVAPLPLPLRVVIILAGGYGAFLSVIVPSSRKVALRIDANGITLGGTGSDADSQGRHHRGAGMN